jgi:hypothetical protein
LHRLLDDGTRVGRFGSEDSSFVGLRRGAQRIRLAAQPKSAPARIESVCHVLGYPVPPIFELAPSWDARDSTVVISTGRFAIDVLTRDVLTSQFTRPKQQRRSTRALARQHVGTGDVVQLVSMPPCTVPADMILAVAEIADVIPAYSALTLDHEGRVWATHFTVGDEPGKADVYDLRSGYLGTVNLGSARPATFFPDGRMVSIELDEDEVPMIRVYRITP